MTGWKDCPQCGSRMSVDEDGHCNAGCQSPKLSPQQQQQADFARDFLKPVTPDAAEKLPDPDYGF